VRIARMLSGRSSRRLGRSVAAVLLLSVGLGHEAQASSGDLAPKHVMFKIGAGHSQSDPPPAAGVGASKRGNGISYHGGPIMAGTTNAYIIWYGDWSGTTSPTSTQAAQVVVTDFLGSVSGSPYFKINTTYYNSANEHVANSVAYAGSTTDNYSQGPDLTDAEVQTVVASAISGNRLAKDFNGVYFVLTSSDVTESSGFLTQYCGWHTHGTISGADIKYSFVGDPSRTLSACAAQTTSPNGNAGADAMVSVIAHELEEAVTDPDLNAWYDTRGYENADKCAWKFGTTYTVNGAKYNMTLGTRNFLIQQNWVNASGGYCATSF
jgi:phosphate-induced protein 1